MLLRTLSKVEGWEKAEDEPDLPDDMDPRLKELFQ